MHDFWQIIGNMNPPIDSLIDPNAPQMETGDRFSDYPYIDQLGLVV